MSNSLETEQPAKRPGTSPRFLEPIFILSAGLKKADKKIFVLAKMVDLVDTYGHSSTEGKILLEVAEQKLNQSYTEDEKRIMAFTIVNYQAMTNDSLEQVKNEMKAAEQVFGIQFNEKDKKRLLSSALEKNAYDSLQEPPSAIQELEDLFGIQLSGLRKMELTAACQLVRKQIKRIHCQFHVVTQTPSDSSEYHNAAPPQTERF